MRTPVARLAVTIVGAAAVIGGIGCGNSKSATAPSARTDAEHFDSLYVAAMLAGTHGDSLRGTVLTYLELAAAEGATPVPVTVTTASGTEQWQALSFEIADTSGSPAANTIATTVVYSDENVTDAVFGEVTTGSDPHAFAEMVASDTIYVASTAATALATVTSHGACPSPSGYQNPIFTTVAQTYHCTLATFVASLNATFPATPGVDSSLTKISFSSLTSNGVRVADASP
jgi:hypothetical protein